ncbi:MAG: aldehyde dehydrogenase family protein [Bacteroidia bacterium]|nr:aldehyde dehydrogenase family protein [Bacteroidia bacterium]NNJ55872.1 aldehyde dehydrogenase family protein [Bacteroidia bacterium]
MGDLNGKSLYEKHEGLLSDAIDALRKRDFYSPYPEHPKAYNQEDDAKGKEAFGRLLNLNFEGLNQEGDAWIGEEVSPYWQTGIGVQYPQTSVSTYIENSQKASEGWRNVSVETRAGILIESLERIQSRFFELAYATMHTTGQSFMMSFQASGPHANDRALEAIAMGVQELTRFPKEITFTKPLGKTNLIVQKTWKPIPKGIGLVIGCSTFPTWNTVPGMFANLVCGNTVIVKPHPKSILAIAIVIEEVRKVITENNLDSNSVQLAVDTVANPITKQLAEHSDIKLVDYTGGSAFGNYIEKLNKPTFVEKSGVNSVIIDSVSDMLHVAHNIAFSSSLYSGQMCTAPQNIFISSEVKTNEGILSFDKIAEHIASAVQGVIEHPKMGAGTLGCVQNDGILNRINTGGNFGGEIILDSVEVSNEVSENARTASPKIIKLKSSDLSSFNQECFGPIIFLIETKDTKESVKLASELASTKGAITCLAFSTDNDVQQLIEKEMNAVFTPVSFNFTGAAFVNQHAAFSDFHGTGGNPAGNASFVNPAFINERFVWVGNRKL